ncbi:MAG: DUF932 domain-containing protein (plasmid) [Candidatus Methanoperedens sp.]|uniref:DUF932 domain-containing protein n=1 Tax=Candidatus Methanoperedens sp. BLZ2 TaxID=2035255 RepID=UPI001143962B|nr:DUF932 domain-containing protein [Candidatus Methanoperedens sp. BLZ2]KAB2945268.1 MAG: DUF932 domain-containing protein [Candidatus Methanoperedens sp.]MBZ0175589.1 DUF932 domain-containing protein [Candidatus Methanoperedens nitroreducens]WAH95138.1 MAG: DUF932 domain-containing protein [Candidatus Methanoperedens sp.]WAM22302.1 MAG: DUF932 domain-containing protein [Candidatus Methanoperedens sp.]
MGNQQLVPVFYELKRQRETRRDLIVDSRTLTAVAEPERIVIDIPKFGAYPLTQWAHGQLSDKVLIPQKYYGRMIEAKNFDLLAENVNAWLPTEDKRMIRILDGNIRAILSDRYRVLDNYDLVFLALDEFAKAGADVHKLNLTESHLFVKAVTPKLRGEIRPGDIVQGGLIIKNSEVGASRFAVEPFVLRLKCTNGLVISQGYSRVHLGKRKEEGEFNWSSETINLENQAIWSAVRDVIQQTFDPASFAAVVEKLKNNAETPVKEPVQAVSNVVTAIGLTEATKEMLLKNFLEEKDYTQWGMTNALTATARQFPAPDDQVNLETRASDIALMHPEAFLEIVDAKPRSAAIRKLMEGDGS